jgi:hypothetical protein
MAIYNTSQTQFGGKTYGPGVARQKIALVAKVAVTTGMLDNADDEVGLVWVPKGFVVTGVAFYSTDVDSGTAAIKFDVGDDSSNGRLLAAITAGQSAGSSTALAATGFLYKYTARTLIKAYVNTAADTAAAGTISFMLEGFVDEEFDTTALVAA